MAKGKSKFTQVGTIRLSQKGKLYINLNQGYDTESKAYTSDNLETLHEALTDFLDSPEKGGLNLMIAKPEEKLQKLLDGEYITEDEYNDRLSKVPEYIKYEITLVTDK